MLTNLTITGIDDTVDINQVLTLSHNYPFVEWGINLSRNTNFAPRFPSYEYCRKFIQKMRDSSVRISAHLCGDPVKNICVGRWWTEDFSDTYSPEYFSRIQINFNSSNYRFDKNMFLNGLIKFKSAYNNILIFQLDGHNDFVYHVAKEKDDRALPIFIKNFSTKWPQSISPLCGYAGGITLENFQCNMEKVMSLSANNNAWMQIDAHARTEDNSALDMKKVEEFLKMAKKYTEYKNTPLQPERIHSMKTIKRPRKFYDYEDDGN